MCRTVHGILLDRLVWHCLSELKTHVQVQTSKAARQEADQLKSQLKEINSNLRDTAKELEKEKSSGNAKQPATLKENCLPSLCSGCDGTQAFAGSQCCSACLFDTVALLQCTHPFNTDGT